MPSRGQAWPREVRERAVRMVLEHQHEHGSQWEAICSVAEKLGPKHVLPAELGPDLVGAVDVEVVGMHPDDLGS